MSSGLEAVKSKRIWFVPDFSVWGVSQDGEIDFLIVESADAVPSILYGNQPIGSSLQEVSYSDLVDHRGNNLPSTIDNPKVMPRSKTDQPIFIVGEETNEKFKIARSINTSGPVLSDLLIMEMEK